MNFVAENGLAIYSIAATQEDYIPYAMNRQTLLVRCTNESHIEKL